MSILQAYQADLQKDIDEGEEVSRKAFFEPRRATDLSLPATKETAKSIGHSMAALVAMERHLWLKLSNIKERDKSFLLDAPLSSSSLFSDSVNMVIDRFQEAKKQAATFQKILPRRSHMSAASSHRAQQKVTVTTRAPPQRDWGLGGHSQPKPYGR